MMSSEDSHESGEVFFSPNDFNDISEVQSTPLESVSGDKLQELSLKILQQSFDFCNEFVPQQLAHIRQNIETSNKRMTKCRSAEEYQKMAASSRVLLQSYSDLLEQSTVIFMSSYRPIVNLIVANKLLESKGLDPNSISDSLDDDEIDDDEMDIAIGSDEHTPYMDD